MPRGKERKESERVRRKVRRRKEEGEEDLMMSGRLCFLEDKETVDWVGVVTSSCSVFYFVRCSVFSAMKRETEWAVNVYLCLPMTSR